MLQKDQCKYLMHSFVYLFYVRPNVIFVIIRFMFAHFLTMQMCMNVNWYFGLMNTLAAMKTYGVFFQTLTFLYWVLLWLLHRTARLAWICHIFHNNQTYSSLHIFHACRTHQCCMYNIRNSWQIQYVYLNKIYGVRNFLPRNFQKIPILVKLPSFIRSESLCRKVPLFSGLLWVVFCDSAFCVCLLPFLLFASAFVLAFSPFCTIDCFIPLFLVSVFVFELIFIALDPPLKTKGWSLTQILNWWKSCTPVVIQALVDWILLVA